METINTTKHPEPWNKGKLVGQKAPLRPKDIWAIRVRLQLQQRVRELALFNLDLDSKLRGCDLVALRVRDISHGERVASRAIVMQRKTQRPVQFEITQATRDSVEAWIRAAKLRSEDFLFPSRIHHSPHIGTRQYARVLHGWIREIGLDPIGFGTHSMRRTKASLITGAPRTCEQCNCCSATRNLKAPCDTLASRSTMRSNWPSRLKSDM